MRVVVIDPVFELYTKQLAAASEANWLYLGLDLGQAQDYTALAVVERPGPPRNCVCRLRGLKRWPLGTSFKQIVEEATSTFASAPWPARLVVDAGGLGRPVIELLRSSGGRRVRDMHAVQITGGNAPHRQPGNWWTVPKADLVGSARVLLETGRLRIAPDLDEVKTFIEELRNFRYEYTESAHLTFNARSGKHDDLVLAVSLSCWAATTGWLDFGAKSPWCRGPKETS